MNTLVVDTDVISYLLKHDSRAELYRPILKDTFPLISFMTLAELEQWALLKQWGPRRREQMEAHLLRYTLVPFDRSLCQAWAEVRYQAYCLGRAIETADAWIAATALLYQVPLVTHNQSHFAWLKQLTVISATS